MPRNSHVRMAAQPIEYATNTTAIREKAALGAAATADGTFVTIGRACSGRPSGISVEGATPAPEATAVKGWGSTGDVAKCTNDQPGTAHKPAKRLRANSVAFTTANRLAGWRQADMAAKATAKSAVVVSA